MSFPGVYVLTTAVECFLGVIKPLNDESTVATAYCTSSGVSVNSCREPPASCYALLTMHLG